MRTGPGGGLVVGRGDAVAVTRKELKGEPLEREKGTGQKEGL